MSSEARARPSAAGQALTHDGLLYRNSADYLAGVLPFLATGLAADEPTFVAVPPANLELLRDGLDGTAAEVNFADMTQIGRNPARIIPAIHQFLDAHPARRVRFVGEPIWPGRSDAEICEATRHEAMLNTAFADAAIDILCPYDVSALDPAAVADAWRTHPSVVADDRRQDSPHYDDPTGLYAGDDPLPSPPDDVRSMPVVGDELSTVRNFVRAFATEIGLSAQRIQDLVLAVNEIATNTILYTGGSGTLQIWSEAGALVCEIRDTGFIADAFVGRRVPNDGADHGRGLWMANQLCDLVQLRSSQQGTIVRVHVYRLAG
jgi:anti-sigma regulatory factor (Ser/Thr protein kinase)